MKSNFFSNKYLKFTFIYGFTRSFVYKKDIEYNILESRSPILYTDHLILSTFSGFRSIFMFPYEIIRDVRQIEMKMRNIQKNQVKDEYIDFLSLLIKLH
jgi:hypothetical protein